VIGEIRMARVIGPETGFWDTTVTQDEWKLDPELQTVYSSWAAHACDLLRWFVGSAPTDVFAFIGEFGVGGPPGRSAMATYRFETGAMAQVWMSYDIPQPGLGSGLQFELVGEDGIIQVDAYGAVRLGLGSAWETPFREESFDPLNPSDPARLRAYAAELDDLIGAVAEDSVPQVNGVEGTTTIAMIQAAELSASTGELITIAT
ncbi:MAG: Gfo/Idh/MocA family oxidoreductase, partial [Acidimicrobiia bacterium]